MIHDFIDKLLCRPGRALLNFLTGEGLDPRFCWTNEAQFLITPPFCTESIVAGLAAPLV
ncbi:FIG00451216: hypothetical protein [Ochrobactrum soli]|uniref:Uncharacterized protein n=1 Tax=Ochrobactrum soli TaxID=2448455 RepID=A0A2P9HQC2_9HYPH|nr:FIG00451216: hypothetical protein [[Ochrobactrum] soli]